MLKRIIGIALVLTLAACSQFRGAERHRPEGNSVRAQLSIGYSLLYQEADGIPKLKWLLAFKEQPEEMARLTNELTTYYAGLADTMRKLARQHPAMRIDVPPMSEIEGDTRKAVGADIAKELAPFVGKTGAAFERDALLMFYNALDEQRHLAAIMVGRESDPALKQFLETTTVELQTRHAKVGALLNRKYFTQ